MNRTNAHWAIALVFVGLAWAITTTVYPTFPATIPTHWDMQGRVDGHGPKATLYLLPTFLIGMAAFYRILPTLAPKSFEDDSVRSAYSFLMVGVLGFFVYMQGVILLATRQHVFKAAHPVDIGRAIFAGMFLLFALIGTRLGKVRRNPVVGVRVPWTLASDRVWDETHRVASGSMVLGGLVGFVVAAAGRPLVYSFAALGASVLVPLVYSFVLSRRPEGGEISA